MEKAKHSRETRSGTGAPAWIRVPCGWLVACALLLSACGQPDAEQRLRSQFEAMQHAAEERQIGGFMAGVSEDFTGNGGSDRAALHNLLRMRALARSNIGVSTGPLDIELQGDTATVRFTVLTTGGSGRFVPDSAQAYEVTSGWRQEDGQWRVYYAQWEPLR